MIIKGEEKKSPRELSDFVALFPFQILLTQTFQVFLPVEKTQTKRPRPRPGFYCRGPASPLPLLQNWVQSSPIQPHPQVEDVWLCFVHSTTERQQSGGRGGGSSSSQPEGGFGKGMLHLETRQEALKRWGKGVHEGRREAGKKEIISSDL